MKGMTTQERYADISKKSGMSIEIVRRVLLAERDSIIESLKRGERATLIGRCTLVPEMRKQVVVGGAFENYIKVNSDVASSIESALENVKEFNESEQEVDYGIRLTQIPALV